MRDFMIFLENYSVKVTAEKVYEYECDNSLALVALAAFIVKIIMYEI